MIRYKNLIEKTTLIKPLSQDEIHKYLIDSTFHIAEYGRHSIIHFAGELCNALEIILSGKVVLARIDEAGKLMTVTEFLEDDVLGGNLLFSKEPFYPMTVTAQKPTVILKIDKDRLFDLFTKEPEFLLTYLEFVSDNALILGDKIRYYSNNTIRECIISFLKQEHKLQQSAIIKLPISKKALAERIGVSRTSLSRELAKMKKDGMITFDAGSITVKDKKLFIH